MMLRSRRILRCALPLAAVWLVSACTEDGREPTLSEIDTVPAADPTTQTNQNIANPVLEILNTFPVVTGEPLDLVWSDEFNGAALDPATWFFATGDGTEKGLPGGWGNNELQYYLPDNAQLEDGLLKITAKRESIGGLNYTSARINTEDRFALQYGRVEASIKLPAGQGLWPAFWMLSQDSDYLCDGEPCVWAAIGEMDIVEAINLDGTGGNEIFATIHYGDEFPGNQSSSVTFTPSRDVTATFNTYAMEWGPDEIRWYFNDELYATQTSSTWFSTADNGGPGAPFDQPFHILLNLAVGGNFPGNGIDGSIFPATMEVDWVRVYSGPDTFEPADPGTIPDAVVYASDPAVMEDLAPPGGIQNFGSGAVIDPDFAGDRDFSPVLAVTSGDAYDPGNVQVGFAAFTGYMQGFAADFGTLDFKVKGLPTGEIEVKFFGGDGGDGSADNAINYNVTTYPGSTALGNGWYQVSIPVSDFATTIAINEGFLLGPPGDQGAQFTFFMTDIGFSGTAGGGGGELLKNGDFEDSAVDKAPWINSGTVFTNNYYTADAADGGNVFDTNVSQVLPITQGADYILTFQARATVDRDIIAGIGLNVGPFTADTRSVSLTTEWQTFSLNLNAINDIGTAESRVLFDLGTVASTVHIDDVSLAEAAAPGVNLLTNGDFQASATDKAPWINAGGIATNNYYTADALDGEPVFVTNLSQVIPLTTAGDYVLSFRARANIARDIIAGIGLNVPNFENDSATVALTTDWQLFTLNLNAFDPIGTAESRVLFDMGGTTSTVDIDDVSLVEAAPFDSGLLTNGDFQAGPDPWLAGVSNPIDPALVVTDGDNSYYSVDVMAAGNPFDVNLSQMLPITPGETYTLTFLARSDVARTMLAGIGLSGGSFANTTQSVDLTTDWQMYSLDLLADGFGDATSRVLFDMGAAVGRVDIDNVALVVSTGGGGGPGGDGSFVNGDFETGGLAGWSQFQFPEGVGSITADSSMQGGRAGTVGRLVGAGTAASANDAVISQEFLAAGTVMPGDAIDVTFDLYGSLMQPGAAVFVEVIFLNADGNDEGGRNFLNGDPTPYTPTDTWTSYSGRVIAGEGFVGGPWDVSGGVTLSLKGTCGAVDGCGFDASFDNVTFAVTPLN